MPPPTLCSRRRVCDTLYPFFFFFKWLKINIIDGLRPLMRTKTICYFFLRSFGHNSIGTIIKDLVRHQTKTEPPSANDLILQPPPPTPQTCMHIHYFPSLKKKKLAWLGVGSTITFGKISFFFQSWC